jgi:hypothetical protein
MKVVASGADWSRADGGAREGVVDRLCGRLWLELDPKRSPGVIDEQTAWRLLQLLYVVRGTTIYGGPIVWPLELLEAWTSLLPTRIVNEEAGDYVELILTDCSQGRHRKAWLRTLSAAYHTSMNAARWLWLNRRSGRRGA